MCGRLVKTKLCSISRSPPSQKLLIEMNWKWSLHRRWHLDGISMNTVKRILSAYALLFAVTVFADVKPAAIFTNEAVLQRNAPVRIWGDADPGESVEIEFAEQRVSAKADADGKWMTNVENFEFYDNEIMPGTDYPIVNDSSDDVVLGKGVTLGNRGIK